MSKTDAIRLAMELGGNATAVGFRYIGTNYQRDVWSVETHNTDERIPGAV